MACSLTVHDKTSNIVHWEEYQLKNEKKDVGLRDRNPT